MICEKCNEEMLPINGHNKCLICGKEDKKEKPEKTGGKQATQWKPGQSGNPNGRPKGSISLVTIIKQKLEKMSPDGKRTAAEVFVENLIQDGLDGQDKARDLIMSYTEAKPATKLDITETELETNSDIYEEEDDV